MHLHARTRQQDAQSVKLDTINMAYYRTYIPDLHSMIDKRNVEVLKLCHSFLDFSVFDATTRVVKSWESLLTDALECPDRETALSKVSSEKLLVPDVSIQVIDAGQNGEEKTQNKKSCWNSNHVIDSEAGLGQGAFSLIEFASDKILWLRRPPWTRHLVDRIVQSVESSSMIPELCVQGGSAQVPTEELPRVVKILLDLLQRHDIELKTATTSFLIRIFRHKTAMWRAIEQIDFICDEGIAIKNRALLELIGNFRIHRRHISSPNPDLSVWEDGVQRNLTDVAIEKCTGIFLQLTGMLKDSQNPQELIITQRLMAHLQIHRESAWLLASPCPSSHLVDLYNIVYSLLEALCSQNIKLQQEVMHQLAFDSNMNLKGTNSNSSGQVTNVNLIQAHIQMESLQPELLVQAVFSQNIKLNSAFGREWAQHVVAMLNSKTVASMKGFKLIRILSALVLCDGRPVKPHQDLVRALIQRNQRVQTVLTPDDVRWHSDWQLGAIAKPGGVRFRNRCTLRTQAAFLVLLSDMCEGKVRLSAYVYMLLHRNVRDFCTSFKVLFSC